MRKLTVLVELEVNTDYIKDTAVRYTVQEIIEHGISDPYWMTTRVKAKLRGISIKEANE